MTSAPTTISPTTLVLGGTGKTGQRLAGLLRDAGGDVRTAARSKADVRFDWTDPATHALALTGVGRVYLVPPALRLDFAGTVHAFLDQAESAGVQHVTYLSARGVELAPDEVAMRAVELDLLDRTGLTHSILRPAFFMQNFTEGAFADALRTGVLALPAGDGAEAFVDVHDIAAVAAVTLLTPSAHASAQYELTGPEALTHAQVAELLSAHGQAVTYQPVGTADWVAGAVAAGLPADYAGFLAALLAGIGEGHGTRPNGDVRSVLGRPPTSLASVLERELGPVRP